mgnify:CR=1 FL=1
MDIEKKKYEISFLAKTLAGGEVVEKTLQKYEAEIFDKGPFSEIKLAYPIKKYKQAYFGFIQFKTLPENADKIQQTLKLNAEILRVLLIAEPITKEEKSIRKVTPKSDKEPVEGVNKVTHSSGMLTNEALEEKLEEILK